MNCSYVEDIIFDILSHNSDSLGGVVSYLVPSAIILVASVILVIGAKIAKALASIVFGGGALAAVFFLLKNFAQVPCDVRLIASLAGGVIAAVVASCLLKTTFFVLGAAAAGFLTHCVFETWPQLHTLVDWPELEGRSLLYWISIASTGLLVGGLVRCKHRKMLVFVTALIGGIGFAYGLFSLFAAFAVTIPSWVLYIIGGALTLLSCYIQRYRPLCSKLTVRENSRSRRSTREKSGRVRETSASNRDSMWV